MAFKDIETKRLVSVTVIAFAMLLYLAPCSGQTLNCSEPTQLALLSALEQSVFNLSAIRPVTSMGVTTNVSIHFILYGILGVDEKAQLLLTYLWLTFWWDNDFVSWDPNECGSSKISLPRKKFWVPDIVINEFMDENKAPFVPYVYVYSNGEINDAQPAKVVSSCNLDIYTFPFDIQNCTLTFNSYLHQRRDIRMVLGWTVEEITKQSKSVMTTMGEWELLDITYHGPGVNTDDSSIDKLAFHIRVRRRATLYVVNLILPSCFLITVDLFSFLLPPQSVDRSSFKMTLILGYTVFLVIMNDLLPITGNAIPLINVFFSLCLALMVASLLETILITDLLHSSNRLSPVPRWIRIIVLQFFGCVVCLPWKAKEPNNADVPLTSLENKKHSDKPSHVSKPVAQAGAATDKEEPRVPLSEDVALQELKGLGRDLQALRVHVDQELGESQSSQQWVQCRLQKIKCSRVLFIFITLCMCSHSESFKLNCSSPTPPALLEALAPVFKLNSIRPVSNLSTPTLVTVEFIMFGILGVDEKAQILTTFIWQYLVWDNEFVSWDPEQCGTALITIPRKNLWVPDIVINEFMEKNNAPTVPYVYLYSSGMIVDNKPVRVVSSCSLDIYMFPFDTQNCTFSFNSYKLRVDDLQIDRFWEDEDRFNQSKKVMTTMGEWRLIGLSVKKFEFPTAGGAYQELRFYVSVRRSPTMYVVNLLLPSCFLIAVDLFSFLLPPQSVDRSLFKMTLILGYIMFLLIMSNLLPVTGNTIPLMNVFLTMCLVLMVGSLLETIIITNLLCGSAHQSPVPWILRLIILQFLGPLMLLPPKPKKKEDIVIENPSTQGPLDKDQALQQTAALPMSKTVEALLDLGRDLHLIRQRVEQKRRSSESSEEWFQMGYITDRLVFVTYTLFITVSFITIIIMWAKAT